MTTPWFADLSPDDAGGTTDPAGGIDHYIHSYYEDIEPIYREQIYKFGI
jgi:integrase/recombinase XerD